MSDGQVQLAEAALRRVFRRHIEIEAAYLYGSYARGRPRRGSDVDIAVVLRQRRRGGERPPTYEVDLADEIGNAINHPGIEVVVLNDASPLLAWEAIHGRRLFARHPRTVAAFEIRTRQRYLDTAHLRAIQDRYLNRIIRRGFSTAVSP